MAFFGDPVTAIPTIALINVWRFVGYTALLVFAGLQTIPKELYEAGRSTERASHESFALSPCRCSGPSSRSCW